MELEKDVAQVLAGCERGSVPSTGWRGTVLGLSTSVCQLSPQCPQPTRLAHLVLGEREVVERPGFTVPVPDFTADREVLGMGIDGLLEAVGGCPW
ncbi:hypothetical protein [Streptomyces sp. NPDC056987]|uniref:hypothetical protein n=1 Tax=Streptomyces sp. NPDC056987 TaxID=3345988 RepID=UPI003630D619